MKEFGSTLEVKGLKDRTQSQSNVDILISPCDPDLRPPHTQPASPQVDLTDTDVEKPPEKSRLEAVASFPLETSKVTTSSSRKSISSIVYSPAQQLQDAALSLTPQKASAVTEESGTEPKQEVEHPGLSDGEQGGETSVDNHGNGEGEESSELLLLGEDRMYPTLRSKSLNVNPRKTRKKEGEETLRSASSIRDLVSVFSGGAGDTRPEPGPSPGSGL